MSATPATSLEASAPEGWNHGYFTSGTYTSNAFRELAPNWIDLAALLAGHPSPRPADGAPFRYLELGSGTGFGLCLLAAAYPEGRFIGIDFLPDHCLQGRFLAQRLGLGNVQFLDADLLDLDGDPAVFDTALGPGGSWHYVVSHGLLSWVSPQVGQALLGVAARALTLGGTFLCSYNTLPGWQGLLSFQKLLQQELLVHPPAVALERSLGLFDQLLGGADVPTPLAAAAPRLAEFLARVRRQNPAYLVHEFCTAHWQPLSVADVHRALGAVRLKPVGSAALPHAFPEVLPAPLYRLLTEEADPLRRELRRDLILNQTFRYDLFAKGSLSLPQPVWQQQLAGQGLRPGWLHPEGGERIRSDYGEFSIQEPPVQELLGRAEAGPFNLGDVLGGSDAEMRATLRHVALLLHGQRLTLDRPAAAAAAALPVCLRANRALIELQQQGFPFVNLAAAQAGTAVPFQGMDGLIHQALLQGLEGELLVDCVDMGIQGLGWQLMDGESTPVLEPAARQKALQRAVEEFGGQRLPRLRDLGALPADGAAGP